MASAGNTRQLTTYRLTNPRSSFSLIDIAQILRDVFPIEQFKLLWLLRVLAKGVTGFGQRLKGETFSP
jgi:hypothetical protein